MAKRTRTVIKEKPVSPQDEKINTACDVVIAGLTAEAIDSLRSLGQDSPFYADLVRAHCADEFWGVAVVQRIRE